MPLKQSVSAFFSSKHGSITCLVIAILIKLSMNGVYMKNGPDRMLFINEAKNFNAGNGFTIDRSFLDDVSKKTYSPVNSSPPFYPFLLSFTLRIFPANPMLACYFIDFLTVLLYFFCLYRLCMVLGFTVASRNYFILLQGFILQEFIFTSGPTDFLALSLLMNGWYFLSAVIENKKRQTNLVLAFLFFLFAALTRYQYLPVVFVAPVLLFYKGYSEKNRVFKRMAILLAVSLSFSFATYFLIQKSISGSLFSVSSTESGWFPENLLSFYPFVLLSVLTPDFWSSKMELLTSIKYSDWQVLLYWLSFFLLFILLFNYYKWIIKNRKNKNAVFYHWLAGGLLSATTVFFLLYSSLTYSRKLQLYEWTFVMDARYFCFPILFVQMTIWRWLLEKFVQKKISTRILSALIVTIYCLESLFGIVHTAKRINLNNIITEDLFLKGPERKTVVRFIEECNISYPDKKVAVFTLNKEYAYLANWYGVNGVFMMNTITNKPPLTSKPVVLLAIIPNNLKDKLSFISGHPGSAFYNQTGNYIFYKIEIEPK